MKSSKILLLSILASVVLSACGNSHEKVYAVDRVEDAAAKAAEKAPVAEPVKFEDEGQPKMGIDTAAASTDSAAADTAATDSATATDDTAAATADTAQAADTATATADSNATKSNTDTAAQ